MSKTVCLFFSSSASIVITDVLSDNQAFAEIDCSHGQPVLHISRLVQAGDREVSSLAHQEKIFPGAETPSYC